MEKKNEEMKNEEMENEEEQDSKTQSSSSSENSITSCPICLGPTIRESFLDKCFHKFCFDCIVQWTKVVSGKHSRKLASVKCPLCKVENFSIIHGFDGSSFQRCYINQHLENGFVFSKAHKYRLQCYYSEPGFLSDIFDVSCYWKSHKYLQPNRWLQSWLRREIQALIQEEDVDIILHHIHGIIDSFFKRSKQQQLRGETSVTIREEFRSLVSDAARPFLAARTDRFVCEVELFLASGFNIEAYDAVCKQRLGWSKPPSISITTEVGVQLGEQSRAIPYLYIFDEDSDGTD